MDIKMAINDFKMYAETYLNSEEKNTENYNNLLRKINHSFRVMDLSKKIAEFLKLNEKLTQFI